MEERISELALPVFAFYLLIACNYTKEIFGCNLQSVLNNSMMAKHMVAFLLLFFLVVAINPEFADQKILKNLLATILIYAWFLVTTRIPFPFMITVLVLLLASYIMSLAKARHMRDQNHAEQIQAEKWQKGMATAAFIVSIVGFAIYAWEKKREYKTKFRWSRFFSGNLHCRGYTPMSARLI